MFDTDDEAVLGSSLLGVAVMSPQGRISFANDQFRTQFDIVDDDPTGTNLAKIMG